MSEENPYVFEIDGITYGFLACQRPLTGKWGSGQVYERIKRIFQEPDVIFGKTDGIPEDVVSVDKNPENNPTITADWNDLPFEDDEFEFGYWDPPYPPNTSKNNKLMKHEGMEIWRTVEKIAILHTHIWPKAWLNEIKEPKRIGMFGVTFGPMKKIRCLQVFEENI